MKTITTIEFLRHKSTQRQIQEQNDLKELLIMSSDGQLKEDDFTIGFTNTVDMQIFVRNVWFDIDGIPFRDWLNQHCELRKDQDDSKWINILGLSSVQNTLK